MALSIIHVARGAAAAIAGAVALVAGLFNQPNVMQSLPPQAAMIRTIVAAPIEPILPAADVSTPSVTPNLLPHVVIRPSSATIAAASARGTALVLPSVRSPFAPPGNSSAASSFSASAPAPTASQPITTSQFLAATQLSLTERHDGPYEVHFTTTVSARETITWDLTDPTVGLNPSYAMTYSCDPTPLPAENGASDQNPIFTPRRSYQCSVSLTPQSGSDRRTQSREFDFTVPPGEITVTPQSAMNTVLKDGEDDGGFVFTNQDTIAVTITALTLDVKTTGLSTAYGPMAFRALDPATGNPTGSNVDLAAMPKDPTNPFVTGETGVTIPVSLTIPPGTDRLLPIQLVGIATMRVSSITPTVTLTLRSASLLNDVRTPALNGAILQWSCVVSFQAYDPNATSGALVAGNACGVAGN